MANDPLPALASNIRPAHAATPPAKLTGNSPHGSPSGSGGKKFDPLQNPLRSVFLRFACAPCGRFDPDGKIRNGKFLCSPCLNGVPFCFGKRAYVSLIYGEASHLILGAVVLGQSLKASRTSYDRVLLITPDVPHEARPVLEEWWILQEVAYIPSAPDLHPTPYEKSRFKEVFTKLHVLNPAVLPYDRVVFLDVDMLVMKNIDDLFELRPPAAMYNSKSRGYTKTFHYHGERMTPQDTYINAGTMVMAPSQKLFELLCLDSCKSDPVWHIGSWAPEQSYLSRVLAGEWSHVSQLYNLEVQLHSGVPLSRVWESAQATDVAVVHFSGGRKVWDCEPVEVVHTVMNEWSKPTFARLTEVSRINVNLRCRVLHAEWHLALAMAVRDCRERGVAAAFSDAWAPLFTNGSFESRAVQVPQECRMPARVGDDIVLHDASNVSHLAKVVCVADGDASIIRWVPLPAELAFCSGSFGLCHPLQAGDRLANFEPPARENNSTGSYVLGSRVALWTGEGHLEGRIVAISEEEYLVQLVAYQAPAWYTRDELYFLGFDDYFFDFQCTTCLAWSSGAFEDARWYCGTCLQDMVPDV